MKRALFIELAAYLFTILFLYAGLSKLLDFGNAVEQVSLSPLLAPIAKPVVIGLPILEILVAIFIFIPSTRMKAFHASLALMLLFTGYVIYILCTNDKLPCTCGGILQEMSWTEHLVFNIAFTLLALTALKVDRDQRRQMANQNVSYLHAG